MKVEMLVRRVVDGRVQLSVEMVESQCPKIPGSLSGGWSKSGNREAVCLQTISTDGSPTNAAIASMTNSKR